MNLKEGDIYSTKPTADKFGAIKILKANEPLTGFEGSFHLIAVTKYFESFEPTGNEPSLNEILTENRFFFRGHECINIYSGHLPGELRYICNSPIPNNDFKVQLGHNEPGKYPLAGGIPKNIGHNVYLEWRWDNEKEQFIEEQEKARAQLTRRLNSKRNRPKKMMDEEKFWELISLINKRSTDENTAIQPVVNELSRLNVTEIKKFEERLAYCLFNLDTIQHAKNIGVYSFKDNNSHFSVDNFLYARCAAVSLGKQVYERILIDPRLMPKEITFEHVLAIACQSYERKKGAEFLYTSGCNYETFSNKEKWKEA